MIKIFDNFYTEQENDKVNSKLSEPHWSYTGGGQTEEGDYFSHFWHMDDLEKDDFFLTLYAKAVSHLQLKNPSLIRIYANCQTGGQCGTPHYDDGDLTFLYYPAPEWNITWQGHLIFLNEKKEGERIVFHKPNRSVLFSGKIEHYADAPIRFFNGLRISLAYKLWN